MLLLCVVTVLWTGGFDMADGPHPRCNGEQCCMNRSLSTSKFGSWDLLDSRTGKYFCAEWDR